MIKKFLLVVYFILLSSDFAPGSYPYAEHYDINLNEPELIELVTQFKKDNPDYTVPPDVGLEDGRDAENDHWYHLYFYYKPENKIVNSWVRQAKQGQTTFAFHAINEGLSLGNWKLINHDFYGSDNDAEKQKFEERILNKILRYKKGAEVQ